MRLIDADKLLDDMYEETGIMTEFRSDYETLVDEQPTVDAQPVVHSEWLPLAYDSYASGNPVWDVWECKNCGCEHYGEENSLTAYCPDCGADMGGETDEKS